MSEDQQTYPSTPAETDNTESANTGSVNTQSANTESGPDTHVRTGPDGALEGSSTGDLAMTQSKAVAGETRDAAGRVVDSAGSEAQAVVSEVGTQARDLLRETRTQLANQASTQQSNLATWLRSVADELDTMGRGTSSDVGRETDASSGPAAAVVRQASAHVDGLASWLDDHEPAEVVDEVARFARRRPGMFLLIAAAAGLVAGRLTRGLTADSTDGDLGDGVTLSSGARNPWTPGASTPASPDAAAPASEQPEEIRSWVPSDDHGEDATEGLRGRMTGDTARSDGGDAPTEALEGR